jgi:hypothetical protein
LIGFHLKPLKWLVVSFLKDLHIFWLICTHWEISKLQSYICIFFFKEQLFNIRYWSNFSSSMCVEWVHLWATVQRKPKQTTAKPHLLWSMYCFLCIFLPDLLAEKESICVCYFWEFPKKRSGKIVFPQKYWIADICF